MKNYPACRVLDNLMRYPVKCRVGMANSVNHDHEQSGLGLKCLLMSICPSIQGSNTNKLISKKKLFFFPIAKMKILHF